MSTKASPSADSRNHVSTVRPHRVLACFLCQQRKIRCDRTFPCSNCTKHNARCVPATQTRPRRKRFPERELLDRLRRYEALLRDNKVKFEPLHKQDDYEVNSVTGADGAVGEESTGEDEGIGETSPSATSLKSENVTTEARSIWQAISQESPSTLGKDTPIANAIENRVKGAWENLIDGDNILLGMHRNPMDLSTFHPGPVAAFKMWQLYLDNIDPLLKVTHAPTLQARFIVAVGDVRAIKPAFEALLFGIYTLAVVSLNPIECLEQLGTRRDDLLTKYQFGCQQALMNAGYLRSSDRECLTALLFYLMSLRPGTNPRSITAMLGVSIRIAQCLGIHRESALAKCSVFEAEMRRRLWWCLMLYDTRMGEKADHRDPTLAPTWDCRQPLSCNDSDLWPEMKEPPPPTRGRTTDSLWIVIRAEIADHIRNSSWFLDFSNPTLKPLARELPENGSPQALHQKLQRDYLRFCDMDNPLHYFAVHTTRSYILRARLFEHFSRFLNTNGQQTENERDQGLEIALEFLDCDTALTGSALNQRHLWYLQSYFPFPAYMHAIEDLRRRPLSRLADRAWQVMGENYNARFSAYFADLGDQRKMITPLFIMFIRTILTAWEARQKASSDSTSIPTPRIVTVILEKQIEAMAAGFNPESGTFFDTPPDTASFEPSPAGAQTQGHGTSFGASGAPNSFAVNSDSMPYPSLVAQDSFAYDPSQYDWFLQPWSSGPS